MDPNGYVFLQKHAISYTIQWRIQDFPQGGVGLVRGGVDSRDGYFL